MNALRTSSRLHCHLQKISHRHFKSSNTRQISSTPKFLSSSTDAKLQSPKHPYVEKGDHLPCRYQEMSNDSLAVLTALEVEEACEELLKRHIMREDVVEYHVAEEKFQEIAKVNREGMGLEALPYKVGIMGAISLGFASFPLCFHEPTVQWFNNQYVTTEVPESVDLETILEIGSWSWNWMEPPLGQLSFFLLCLQFARANVENLGLPNYTRRMKYRRAKKLQERFPEYEGHVVMQYSMSTKYY